VSPSSFSRAIVLVLDSVGVGELPDAAEYGDQGSNTLGNIARRVPLQIPTLRSLGLSRIVEMPGGEPVVAPAAAFGRMAEHSPGKDSVTGHWELMGLAVEHAFPVFPHGFPEETIREFERRIGRKTLGNTVASGTVIIEELGPEHVRTGCPIVYTSADSVFQIAAHEDVIPLPGLYEMCLRTRELCDAWRIGRVIARPFVGRPGHFTRTTNRRDYSMCPPGETALDILQRSGWPVTGIGKIENIFAGQGIGRSRPSHDNAEGMRLVREELASATRGLVFANLVDFDMLYGHRNDIDGYGAALEAFDRELGGLLPALGLRDMLIVTADHGCDPAFPGTDHTREYVPLLVYGPSLPARPLGVRRTFADIGASVLDAFGLGPECPGQSFMPDIRSTPA
jgi:phosphopentomutase